VVNPRRVVAGGVLLAVGAVLFLVLPTRGRGFALALMCFGLFSAWVGWTGRPLTLGQRVLAGMWVRVAVVFAIVVVALLARLIGGPPLHGRAVGAAVGVAIVGMGLCGWAALALLRARRRQR
jgi:hypothetical protein